MRPVTLDLTIETWLLKQPFVIARGTKTHATVVVVTLSDGVHQGRGECVPYARYGETAENVAAQIRSAGPLTTRADLARMLPAGAARNALDCAFWDLEAKRGTSAISDRPLRAVETCFTLSLGAPNTMAQAARMAAPLKLLKLKLGGDGDGERMRAVRAARPDARLVVDANESWRDEHLDDLLRTAADCGVELVEQPLPAGDDAALARRVRDVPVCADESVHTSADMAQLSDRYDAVNIKLDKTGGLTEGLEALATARRCGLRVMIGCMVATSLAMAPALILAQDADWVDLDGPLLLGQDRAHGLRIANGWVYPPNSALWG